MVVMKSGPEAAHDMRVSSQFHVAGIVRRFKYEAE